MHRSQRRREASSAIYGGYWRPLYGHTRSLLRISGLPLKRKSGFRRVTASQCASAASRLDGRYCGLLYLVRDAVLVEDIEDGFRHFHSVALVVDRREVAGD